MSRNKLSGMFELAVPGSRVLKKTIKLLTNYDESLLSSSPINLYEDVSCDQLKIYVPVWLTWKLLQSIEVSCSWWEVLWGQDIQVTWRPILSHIISISTHWWLRKQNMNGCIETLISIWNQKMNPGDTGGDLLKADWCLLKTESKRCSEDYLIINWEECNETKRDQMGD